MPVQGANQDPFCVEAGGGGGGWGLSSEEASGTTSLGKDETGKPKKKTKYQNRVLSLTSLKKKRLRKSVERKKTSSGIRWTTRKIAGTVFSPR